MIEGASLAAAELMDAEVMSVLRRAVLNGYLQEARAQMGGFREHRVWVRPRAPLPLMTADGRLSRASGLGVVVQHVRMGGRGPLACGGSMDYTGPGLR